VAVAVGIFFIAFVPSERKSSAKGPGEQIQTVTLARPLAIAAIYLIAVVAGGITFNVTTIALPKVIDERLGFAISLGTVGTLATAVFFLGAVTQVTMGRLIDRFELPWLFVGLAVLQPLGLVLAAATTGAPMLLGMLLVMASIYGQVVVNDAMIARYVAPHLRAKAFGLRYFLGFSVSGLAVPMIALFHRSGGFPLVLGITALFGVTIFASAVGFLMLARPARAVAAAAE
jgi:MFS family permease